MKELTIVKEKDGRILQMKDIVRYIVQTSNDKINFKVKDDNQYICIRRIDNECQSSIYGIPLNETCNTYRYTIRGDTGYIIATCNLYISHDSNYIYWGFAPSHDMISFNCGENDVRHNTMINCANDTYDYEWFIIKDAKPSINKVLLRSILITIHENYKKGRPFAEHKTDKWRYYFIEDNFTINDDDMIQLSIILDFYGEYTTNLILTIVFVESDRHVMTIEGYDVDNTLITVQEKY